ncbi:MAG: hypothetical protein LBE57_00885 [Methanosarcinales archaeon]|jgi:hypothetical protein|nr:hypothetical protein [Methanosarcinales archaeon]
MKRKIVIERQNLIPALILALLGIIFIGWSIFILITSLNPETLEGIGALFTFFIAGVMLIAFSVYYAKTGGESDKEWESDPDDFGIEWEFDEDFDDEFDENLEIEAEKKSIKDSKKESTEESEMESEEKSEEKK